MTILVAVNESECADRAVETADALCAKVGGRLVLLHVVKDSHYDGESLPAEMIAQLRRDGAQLLEKMRAKVKQSARPKEMLRRGRAAEQILLAAEKLKADLIIIGTHGHGGLEHLLLGNETEPVVRLAPCPVMTVRHIAKRSAAKSGRRK